MLLAWSKLNRIWQKAYFYIIFKIALGLSINDATTIRVKGFAKLIKALLQKSVTMWWSVKNTVKHFVTSFMDGPTSLIINLLSENCWSWVKLFNNNWSRVVRSWCISGENLRIGNISSKTIRRIFVEWRRKWSTKIVSMIFRRRRATRIGHTGISISRQDRRGVHD